jgi:hypothetical protein
MTISRDLLLCVLADVLSALDFDETGDYLATGDRGGRVVVFENAASTNTVGSVVTCLECVFPTA